MEEIEVNEWKGVCVGKMLIKWKVTWIDSRGKIFEQPFWIATWDQWEVVKKKKAKCWLEGEEGKSVLDIDGMRVEEIVKWAKKELDEMIVHK